MAYKDFTDFAVWKLGFNTLTRVYSLADEFPQREQFILTQDLLRSANSVIHNVAEGYGRFENRDKTRFYKISRGSAYEAISQLLVARHRQYAQAADLNELIECYKQCITQLDRLIISLERKS